MASSCPDMADFSGGTLLVTVICLSDGVACRPERFRRRWQNLCSPLRSFVRGRPLYQSTSDYAQSCGLDDCFCHYCRLSRRVLVGKRQIISEKHPDHMGVAPILDEFLGPNIRMACLARTQRCNQRLVDFAGNHRLPH